MIRFRMVVLSAVVLTVQAWPADALAEGKGRTKVGPGAVWRAGPRFMDTLHARCGSLSYPRLGECLVAAMRDGGASSEALRFTEGTGNEAWLRAFRETGKVDIAYVTYPFRANENQGVLLVNGDPAATDVDGTGMPSEGELAKDLVYQELAKRYPAVSIWPGDRFGTETPVAESLAGGGSRFRVGYVLRNGCHACEEIGSAVFAFEFDVSAKFVGKRLMMVTDESYGGVSDPTVPVKVRAGEGFSLVLASNPTTGYRWNLAKPLDDTFISLSGKRYSPAKPGMLGSGGRETWTFTARARGRTVVFLSYNRPWEKGVAPLREAAFVILVR